MKSCEHNWAYEHMIWEASGSKTDAVAVGRVCTICGKKQTAVADNWHALPKSYVDMRTTLERLWRDSK